ncbi:MAG: hypothetical protein J0L66_00325 [Cytophagales bacterium]|nr:hypothetical protein [Cytophagales bacterium]
MDLTAFMKKYADQTGGQFTQYDPSHSIIIVSLPEGRFQTVIGTIRQGNNQKQINLNSKVCEVKPGLDFKGLLEQAAAFTYSRFIISDNHLQLETTAQLDTVSEASLTAMLQEVASLADQYEHKLTDSDIH